MKLNLRSIFTTPELLGIIKKVLVLYWEIPTSSFCAEPFGEVAESRGNLELDSATAGMKALVQNDRSVNRLRWF